MKHDRAKSILKATTELDLLSDKKNMPHDLLMGSGIFVVGRVWMAKHERAAIRRYLIRNRRRLLKKEGLL